MTRTATQIRQDFIDFFRARGHEFVPSSPVVPHDDPTLLFTNAGMNQFKDVFLATGTRPYTRAANTQKCIRAGGKHNDLDDVGHDTYHHTFFEMLGNWSFGDYFKEDAIRWAWELLTDVWGLDKTRLHATYFEGDPEEGLEPDLEAKELWASVTDINPAHIHPGNKKDNFWEMGETGPCGPCSEVHIDLTPDKSGAKLVNAGDARVIEIWNLVFIQFNRAASGILSLLSAKHVDTGMGLERVTALLQDQTSNYDTDLFAPIFAAIRDVTGAPPYGGTLPEEPRTSACAVPGTPDASHELISEEPQTSVCAVPKIPGAQCELNSDRPRGLKPAAPQDASHATQENMIDVSYRVIADHVRCLTFALTDGGIPDREGRGYVLRRILRRAVRYGWQYLNTHEPFLYKLVPTIVDVMGDAFPELKQKPEHVAEIIRDEEESFDKTLDRGIALFEEAADYAARHHHGEIHGEDAFKLHDTYGFPIDLTEIMAQEKGLRVDIGEYLRLMELARKRAREWGKAKEMCFGEIPPEILSSLPATDDSSKYHTDSMDAEAIIVARFKDDGTTEIIQGEGGLCTGESGALVLDQTCFYAEQGGQVGDQGVISSGDDAQLEMFQVVETRCIGDVVVHYGKVRRGSFGHGEPVIAEVDKQRQHTIHNHTATHLMNWALRKMLGEHVQQKGSLVDPDKTRFDFSHSKPLTPEEIERIEQLVNERIQQKLPVYDKPVSQEDAFKVRSLRAVFGEKYPDTVRVLSIGTSVDELLANPDNPAWQDISIELCGGTHVKNTGEIKCFAIASEEAVAKGVRRVVGITGDAARKVIQNGTDLLERADALRRADSTCRDDEMDFAAQLSELQRSVDETTLRVVDRVKLREAIGELQQIVKKQQKDQAAEALDVVNARIKELLESAPKIGQTTIVVAEMPDVPIEQLKHGADTIKQKCGSTAILFGTSAGGKAMLLAAMSPDLIKRGLKAGDLVKHIAPIVKGGGGGPPTMAQAGGKDPAKLHDALRAGRTWIEERLS